MSQTNYSLVSLDELKGAWGVTGFDESVDDARNVRALISALQEATRQVKDHCGVRFLPYLGSYRKELDGNLYGIGFDCWNLTNARHLTNQNRRA